MVPSPKMEVYRFTLAKWSETLKPSGYAGRWNSKGVFMLYTSSSIALATLENLVHRSGEGLNKNFKTIEISIPEGMKIHEIKIDELPNDWYQYENYRLSQAKGDHWIKESNSPLLKVPSAIIKKESNYLLNPNHKDFEKIAIKSIEDFEFDPRLIQE